jgi:outer membrane protein assembly factor BamA
MRGFTQNIRNGNNFAVLNSELRFPVFRYFSKKPVKSDFFNNFQIVGFGDLGTAWTGWNPWSEANTVFKRYVYAGTIKVTIKDIRDPIVGGMGVGVRTRILGYFLRVDYAWGVENLEIQKPLFYFSLSTDF